MLCSEAVAQKCSVKKAFLKISQKSQENTCARVSLFKKFYKTLILTIYFVLKRSHQLFILYRDIFSSRHGFGVPFPKSKTFFEIFRVLPIGYSLRKNHTRNFCLFVYLRSYNDKSKFWFLQTVHSRRNTSFLRTIHFLTKCYYRFLALIFLCTLKKNTAEKLCKTLEMELKSHTPAGPDFFLRKSNLKFCFIFDMILLANAQGLVNFRLACS